MLSWTFNTTKTVIFKFYVYLLKVRNNKKMWIQNVFWQQKVIVQPFCFVKNLNLIFVWICWHKCIQHSRLCQSPILNSNVNIFVFVFKDLASVHHWDPSRRVPWSQARVRQARVPDVRQVNIIRHSTGKHS